MTLLRVSPTIAILAVLGLGSIAGAQGDNASLALRYDTPAQGWDQALPVGNGRLGAMVFGGTAEERVQINEDTVWAGEPHDYAHKGAVKYLPEIRRLLFEDQQREAEALAQEQFMSVPLNQLPYQPASEPDGTDSHRAPPEWSAISSCDTRVELPWRTSDYPRR